MQQTTQLSFRTLTSNEDIIYHLNEAGYASVFDIARQSDIAFCQQLSALPPEQAQEIHALAQQRVACLSSLVRAYRSRNEPVMQGIPKLGVNPAPSALAAALERSLGDAPDFGELFPERSEDGYADIASIQSLFSPGRYLTELYKVAKGLHAAESPLHIDQRRPDINKLVLSQSNMLNEVSTLGILVDVLQAGIRRANSATTMTSLETAYYPMTLPYHDNLVQIRAALQAKSVSLQQVWAILADDQARRFAPITLVSTPTNALLNVMTPSPTAREELSLSPATFQLLASGPANAATIRRDYGLASESIHTELKLVSKFCDQTRLTFNQLVELTGQADPNAQGLVEQSRSRFFKFGAQLAVSVAEFGQSYVANSSVTATPLLVIPGLAADAPVLNLTTANAVMLADRAERLIRLQRKTTLPFHELDWLIKNANLAYSPSRATSLLLDTPVIEAIAEFQRLNDAYGLSADAFACFIGEVNTYAPEHASSLYQQLFASPTGGGVVPFFTSVNFDPAAAEAHATVIAGALRVSPNELFAMADLAFADPTAVAWSARAAGQLYRQAMIPQMLGITYYQATRLWKMLNPDRDVARALAGEPSLQTLELIRQTETVLQWMTSHQLDIDAALSLITDQYSEDVTPELYNFIDNIYTTLSSDADAVAHRAGFPLTKELSEKLYRLIAAAFKVKANVMARLISWLDTTFTTAATMEAAPSPYGLGAFWEEIDQLFNSGAQSFFDELLNYPNIARYSQAMGQYALLAQWANLTEQDLGLITAAPSTFTMAIDAAPNMSLLLHTSRLKEWQQRVLVPEAQAMSYFTYVNQPGCTTDSAIELLARLHGWDVETVLEVNNGLVARGAYAAFPQSFADISLLEASMRTSLQSEVSSSGIDGLYRMSLKNQEAEHSPLILRVAEACAATLSSANSSFTGSAPVASNVTVSGSTTVGGTLTGSYTYVDADNDAEAATTFQWYRKTAGYGGGSAGVIAGATNNQYTLTVADEGATLQFAVTPIASMGTPIRGSEQKSAPTAAIAARPGSAPVASSVSIAGTVRVGQTLTANYNYSDPDSDVQGATRFQWSRKTRGHGGGAVGAIAGAVNRTYVLNAIDEGATLEVTVTPVALTGSPKLGTSRTSAATTIVSAKDGSAPQVSGVSISGNAKVGELLTCGYVYTDADNDAEGVSTFQWSRKTAGHGGGIVGLIPGATTRTYRLLPADEGATLEATVTPVALTGAPKQGTSKKSAATAPVGAKNGTAPEARNVSIGGSVRVGEHLSCNYEYADTDGDAEGVSTFQWSRRTSGYGGGAAGIIAGATDSTYLLTVPDEGATLEVTVTPVARSGLPKAGSSQTSTATHAVAGKVGSPPEITNVKLWGLAKIGEVLSGTYEYYDPDSDVEGVTTFQWYRNRPATEEAEAVREAILGAIHETYTVTRFDQAATLEFAVTPVALTGEPKVGTEQRSAPTEVVYGQPPRVDSLTIDGYQEVGATLTTTYAYFDADNDPEGATRFRWLRQVTPGDYNLTDPAQWEEIVGATSSTLLLTEAEAGRVVVCWVTPVSAEGAPNTGHEDVAHTMPIILGPPVVSAVAISGCTQVGETLSGTYNYDHPGGGSESGIIFQWFRTGVSDGADGAILGATNKTYTLTPEDHSGRLQFGVVPRNGTEQRSAPTSRVTTGRAPEFTVLNIDGYPAVGETLTVTYTYFDADLDPEGATRFRWSRQVTPGSEQWEDIVGATQRTLLLTEAEVGRVLACWVTPVSTQGTPNTGTEQVAHTPPIYGVLNDK